MFYYLNKIYYKMNLIFDSKITWKIKQTIDNIVFTIHFTNKEDANSIMNILTENKVNFNILDSRILNPDMIEEIELYKRTIKRINKLIDELDSLFESISYNFELPFNEEWKFPSKFYINNCNIEIDSKKGDFFYEYYMNKIIEK